MVFKGYIRRAVMAKGDLVNLGFKRGSLNLKFFEDGFKT